MKHPRHSLAPILAILAFASPVAAAQNTIWQSDVRVQEPVLYADPAPISRLTPEIANPETYAPAALFAELYPSIPAEVLPSVGNKTNNQPSIASKNDDSFLNQPRVNLSPSYVQEFAYISTYSNIRKYVGYYSVPSIRLSLAIPRFGNGLGGGYPPLQFGFGPAAFRFW